MPLHKKEQEKNSTIFIFLLVILFNDTLLVEETVIVEFGES